MGPDGKISVKIIIIKKKKVKRLKHPVSVLAEQDMNRCFPKMTVSSFVKKKLSDFPTRTKNKS